MKKLSITSLSVAGLALLLVGCSPTVSVKAPDKPITINVNVKVQHEIRLKVEKEVDALFEEKDLF